MGPPFIYRGEPNVELFQKWKFAVEMWVRTNYIRRKNRISQLQNYMEGKAFSFYSTKVAHNPRKWDLKSFFIGLFDYCFPNNFIEE